MPAARRQASTWGAMRQMTRRATRAADPTDNLTRIGKPHEPRGTKEKQPRPATPTTTPSTAGYRDDGASSRIRRAATPSRERAGTRERNPKQQSARDGREPAPQAAPPPDKQDGTRSGETINGGRHTGLTRPTTTPIASRRDDDDEEEEPRRQRTIASERATRTTNGRKQNE